MSSYGSNQTMDESSGQHALRREVPDVLVQNIAGMPEVATDNNANFPLDLEPLNSIVPLYKSDSYTNPSILGAGSFAIAFKVLSIDVGTAVVKMNKQQATVSRRETNSQLSSEEARKRRREFVNCFLLNNHPNIVSLYGYIYETDREHPIGILMEYMAGRTVQDYIECHQHDPQQFPLSEIMQNTWSKHIARGLKFMHQRGIAHRDIKPNNILLTADYRTAKIADFGLAKNLTESSHSQHTSGIGFWQYTAPEMIMENVYDYPVDSYSFGMVLYFIYYQRAPFDYNITRINRELYNALKGIGQNPLRPELRVSRTPIDHIIEQCWPVDPQQRLTMLEIVRHFYSAEGIQIFPAYDV